MRLTSVLYRWLLARGRMENQTETLALAPAAGAGVGKLLADALLADPQFVQELKRTAMEGLRAMSPRRWDKDSGGWIADPDCRVRIQTLALLLAHMEGEPVKRIIHQHLGAGGQVDIMGALRESPALLAAAEREIEKAKFRDRHKKAKPVQAADNLDA